MDNSPHDRGMAGKILEKEKNVYFITYIIFKFEILKMHKTTVHILQEYI